MIRSRHEYLAYLEADRLSLACKKSVANYTFHDRWRFQRCMRRLEYQQNCKKGRLAKLVEVLLTLRFRQISTTLGFSIAPNTFGPGLAIMHRGTIVVNSHARIGANCRILEGVNIGATGGSNASPQIGNNVFIASGAKLFGDIRIADGVSIGANAVVVKSFDEPNITVGGVPAKKISENGAANAGWAPRNTYLGE